MSIGFPRAVIWFASSLALSIVFLFLVFEWLAFAEGDSIDGSLGVAILLVFFLFALSGCAYIAPFLPPRGMPRHLIAAALGSLTLVGTLLIAAAFAFFLSSCRAN